MTMQRVVQTTLGPMAESVGAEQLTLLLDRFARRIEEVGSPLERWMNPGIERDEVVSKLSSVGLTANDEVIAWFGWHNGLRVDADAYAEWRHASPVQAPMSLDDAIMTYRLGVLEFDLPAAPNSAEDEAKFYSQGIGLGWLKLVNEASGFAVNCTQEPNRPPLIRVPSFEWFHEFFLNKLQAVSLCTLVGWWLESLESGAFVWDPKTATWGEPLVSLLPQTQRDAAFF